MKEHEVALLLNDLKLAVLKLCPDAPQQLRETLRTTVLQHIKPDHKCFFERALDGTLVCECGAWKIG